MDKMIMLMGFIIAKRKLVTDFSKQLDKLEESKGKEQMRRVYEDTQRDLLIDIGMAQLELMMEAREKKS